MEIPNFTTKNETLQDSTRRRIIALQQRLVRIQTQCIVTRDSIDARAQRCSVLESSIRTLNAFHDHGTFVAWRSLVSRMWHQVRRTVDWTEVRGLKYLCREMVDTELRLRRQCVCVEWGMDERIFICCSALADQEDDYWEAIVPVESTVTDEGDHDFTRLEVPDFGCRVVKETMEFAAKRMKEELAIHPRDCERRKEGNFDTTIIYDRSTEGRMRMNEQYHSLEEWKALEDVDVPLGDYDHEVGEELRVSGDNYGSFEGRQRDSGHEETSAMAGEMSAIITDGGGAGDFVVSGVWEEMEARESSVELDNFSADDDRIAFASVKGMTSLADRMKDTSGTWTATGAGDASDRLDIPKMSRIPRAMTTTTTNEMRDVESSHRQKIHAACRRSRIPIVPTLQLKRRASIAAIPLTPPRQGVVLTPPRQGAAMALSAQLSGIDYGVLENGKCGLSSDGSSKGFSKARRSLIPRASGVMVKMEGERCHGENGRGRNVIFE